MFRKIAEIGRPSLQDELIEIHKKFKENYTICYP